MRPPQWPAAWDSAPRREAAQVHQPRDRRRDRREQAQRVPVGLAQNTKGFEPPNAMLDMHPHRSLLPIRVLLLRRQLSPAGFTLGRLNACRAQVSQVSLLDRVGKLGGESTALIEPFISARARVTRVDREQFAVDIGG